MKQSRCFRPYLVSDKDYIEFERADGLIGNRWVIERGLYDQNALINSSI